MEGQPGTFVDAIDAIAGVGDRGWTLIGEHDGERFVSFAEIADAARRRASRFRGLGLEKGDRVALVVDDNQEFIITFLGAMIAGIVPVPIYPPFSLGRLERYVEIAGAIAHRAGARALVTTSRLQPLLAPLTGTAPSIGLVVTVGLSSCPDPQKLPDRVDVRPEDLAFLQFTSGSTGLPKGVMVSHANLMANARAIVDALLARSSQDKAVSWLPLYHDMGLIGFVLAPILRSTSVVLLSTAYFLKRPGAWIQALHDHGATMTVAPNFAYALSVRRIHAAEASRWDLSHVRVLGCGSEPVSADTLRAFAAHFARTGLRPDVFLPCYGMAEATLAVTCHPVGLPWRSDIVDSAQLRTQRRAVAAAGVASSVELVSCGKPLAGQEVRIADEDGQPLPERFVGEIQIRGPNVTSGYFNDAAATASARIADWLRTGDLGYVADGDLFVTGRKKDLIIVAGHNYAPEEIEGAVAGMSGIRQGNVVAFARPGARGTEDVVLVCELPASSRTAMEEVIRRRVSERTGLQVADIVFLRPGTLPRTSSGKLQRARTRELYLEGTLTS